MKIPAVPAPFAIGLPVRGLLFGRAAFQASSSGPACYSSASTT